VLEVIQAVLFDEPLRFAGGPGLRLGASAMRICISVSSVCRSQDAMSAPRLTGRHAQTAIRGLRIDCAMEWTEDFIKFCFLGDALRSLFLSSRNHGSRLDAGDGGIVFRWRSRKFTWSLECNADGSMESSRMEENKLV